MMKPENIALVSVTARVQRSIGAILVDAGKLSVEDAERVLRLQRQEKLLFGDAALRLGVVTQADVDAALSRQFDYPYLQRGSSAVSESVVTAYDPFGEQAEVFRTLRSQLMLRWFDGDSSRRVLAVVSPEAQDGRSFVAANLAVVFAQLGERVLLIDADLRSPKQHTLFALDNRSGLSAVLSGRHEAAEVEGVPGLEHLSILPAGPMPPNPVELLSRPGFSRLLDDLKPRFDIVLLDSPSAAQYADAQTIAAKASGSLMVLRKDGTRANAARQLAEKLRKHTTFVGTVLNGC
jgi:receptor protein-tyrosine kinase